MVQGLLLDGVEVQCRHTPEILRYQHTAFVHPDMACATLPVGKPAFVRTEPANDFFTGALLIVGCFLHALIDVYKYNEPFETRCLQSHWLAVQRDLLNLQAFSECVTHGNQLALWNTTSGI
jgi:hypothetical protein